MVSREDEIQVFLDLLRAELPGLPEDQDKFSRMRALIDLKGELTGIPEQDDRPPRDEKGMYLLHVRKPGRPGKGRRVEDQTRKLMPHAAMPKAIMGRPTGPEADGREDQAHFGAGSRPRALVDGGRAETTADT